MSEQTHVEVSSSEFLVFTSEANGSIEVHYEHGTIWLSQKLMAQLFDVDVRTISEHLRNIYNSGELTEGETIRNFRMVRTEGSRQVTRGIDHYNLDAIISVGYHQLHPSHPVPPVGHQGAAGLHTARLRHRSCTHGTG